jgi:curli biogenesis system outer membrane secretion channel CsgG
VIKPGIQFITGIVALVLLSACASTGITSGDGASISQAQLEPYNGPKARITVGPVIDKSGDSGDRSLTTHLGRMRGESSSSNINKDAVLGGVRDMLTTALFNSNRYIVLERENINDAMVEQDFSQSRNAGEASRIPLGMIEGAELLVIGSLTAFKPAKEGGGFPVPIPLSRNVDDIAIFRIGVSKSYIAMDLRVIDTATGRILATLPVEGSSWKSSATFHGVAGKHTNYHYLQLPGLIRVFSNTPIEKALNEMVHAAVVEIVKRTPDDYRKHQ